MQENQPSNKTPLAVLFNAKEIGESLKEVAVDIIKAEDQDITSRWFHSSKDADFFIWRDQSKNIIKQQITYLGQVVEWNLMEGVRTGYLLEDDTGKDIAGSVIIRYDSSPQKHAIEQSVEVIAAITGLNEADKVATIENFVRSPLFANMNIHEIIKKYSVYMRPRHASQGNWFGNMLRRLGVIKKK